MALQASGTITIQQIEGEFGGTPPTSLSEYYRGGGLVPNASINNNIPTAGSISFSDFYGTAQQFDIIISTNTLHANLSTIALAQGWDGSAPLVVTVASGVYVWSDNTSLGGLIIPSSIPGPVTIYNNGYIIGRGGDGGGNPGGPALVNQVSGVTIFNNAGAFIAGGGGGGGGNGGGGGAGGGNGGPHATYGGSAFSVPGAGGAIGQVGGNGSGNGGNGGGAGGGGGDGYDTGSRNFGVFAGGGGGRILPGVGGAAGTTPGGFGARGAGGAGGSGGSIGGDRISGDGGGGGGGWGAPGGQGGGAGGAAISGTSVTLINSGTIYGTVV